MFWNGLAMGIADYIRMLGTFNQHLPMVLFEKYVLYKVFLNRTMISWCKAWCPIVKRRKRQLSFSE